MTATTGRHPRACPGARFRRRRVRPRGTRPRGAGAVGRVHRRRAARRHGVAGGPDRRAQPPASPVGGSTQRGRVRRVLRAGRRSAGHHAPPRPRHDLRLCPPPRLPRHGERHAEAPGAVHRQPLWPGGEGVRGHGAGDGEAARPGRRIGVAGQAHEFGVAQRRVVAVPWRDLHDARPASRCPARRPLRHLRPLPNRLPNGGLPPPRTGWMRRAASPTSRSSIAARSRWRYGR